MDHHREIGANKVDGPEKICLQYPPAVCTSKSPACSDAGHNVLQYQSFVHNFKMDSITDKLSQFNLDCCVVLKENHKESPIFEKI